MRQIKFRCWDKDKKEWGNLIMARSEAKPCVLSLSIPENDHLDIMQFTGLLDKNGKEIYEGDVLHYEFDTTDSCCEQTHIDAEVRWYRDCWVLENVTKGKHKIYDFAGMIFPWEEREIIGNIYENPSLLI